MFVIKLKGFGTEGLAGCSFFHQLSPGSLSLPSLRPASLLSSPDHPPAFFAPPPPDFSLEELEIGEHGNEEADQSLEEGGGNDGNTRADRE